MYHQAEMRSNAKENRPTGGALKDNAVEYVEWLRAFCMARLCLKLFLGEIMQPALWRLLSFLCARGVNVNWLLDPGRGLFPPVRAVGRLARRRVAVRRRRRLGN